MGEEEQQNYPSLSSFYSKHFTGNCCRHTTDREANRQTHTHTLTQNTPNIFIASRRSWDRTTEQRKKTQDAGRALQSLPPIPFSWLTPVRLGAKKVMLSDLLSLSLSVSQCACSQTVAALRDVLSSRHSVYALPREMFLWCCSKCLSREISPPSVWQLASIAVRRACSEGEQQSDLSLPLYLHFTL